MEIMTSYVDLIRKIDILETQLELTEAEITYWFGGTNIIFGSQGSAKFGMIAAIGNVESLHERKHNMIKMLTFYKEIRNEIKSKIDKLEGLQYIIARMKFIEGKDYREIAEELGYSYGYIRRIVSRGNKEVTTLARNL